MTVGCATYPDLLTDYLRIFTSGIQASHGLAAVSIAERCFELHKLAAIDACPSGWLASSHNCKKVQVSRFQSIGDRDAVCNVELLEWFGVRTLRDR